MDQKPFQVVQAEPRLSMKVRLETYSATPIRNLRRRHAVRHAVDSLETHSKYLLLVAAHAALWSFLTPSGLSFWAAVGMRIGSKPSCKDYKVPSHHI